MTSNELKGVVSQWYTKNKGEAMVASAFAFQNDNKDASFLITRCKDVKEGISLRLESGESFIDGIFVFQTEQMVCKESGDGVVFRGASIE